MNAINALSGWSLGYEASRSAHFEDEHLQGKNYRLSALFQIEQLNNLITSAGFLNNYLQKGFGKTALKAMTSSMGTLSGSALILFFSIVKEGGYPAKAEIWNEFQQIRLLKLPVELGWKGKKICHFFSEYSGKIIRFAEIAGGVAIAVFFNPYYGGGILAGHLFEVADSSGLIPRKISLFIETYIPIVASGNSFVNGSYVMRAFSIYSIATVVISKMNSSFHQIVDSIINTALKFLSISTPKLSDFDAPLQCNELSFEDIEDILKNRLSSEINPAHCTKPVSCSSLLEDREFDKLLTCFDQVDWTLLYSKIVKKKLAGDERFIDFIGSHFPEKLIDQLKSRDGDYHLLDQCIEELAGKKNLSKEQFATQCIREQMVTLVNILNGRVGERVKGSQQDLQTAIDSAAKILPYLESLKKEGRDIEFEDCLLKLAIEGGEYCARGIKRSTGELEETLLHQDPVDEEVQSDDPMRIALKIRLAMQDCRRNIIQNKYKKLIGVVSLDKICRNDDVHTFDYFRIILSRGFFPLTNFESLNFSICDLATYEIYTPHRNDMLHLYDIEIKSVMQETVKGIGNLHFTEYVRGLIKKNEKLTDKQKAEIEERIIDGQVDDRTLQLLALVSIGILRRKSQ